MKKRDIRIAVATMSDKPDIEHVVIVDCKQPEHVLCIVGLADSNHESYPQTMRDAAEIMSGLEIIDSLEAGHPILDYINGYVHMLLNEQISPMPLSKGGH